jgi:hypothetical protein
MMVTPVSKALGALAGPASAAGLLFCASVALAQTAPAPAPTAPAQIMPDPQLDVAPTTEPQPAPAPRRSNAPGLLSEIGRWFDESIGNMTNGLNNARETVGSLGDKAGEAAKNAATSVTRMPTTSIIAGREHCVRTANGGPDCATATDVLCRSKGYSAGTSLHIQSEQKCPVWGWIAGDKPVGKCGSETYVTSAVCR